MSIYKYVSCNRIEVLENKMIRLTQQSCLNDPFEMRVVIDGVASKQDIEKFVRDNFDSAITKYYFSDVAINSIMSLEEYLVKIKSTQSDMMKAMDVTFKATLERLREKVREIEKVVGVLSLTESPDNLLMWAHYADNHRGMVIEFDKSSEFFNRKRSDYDECYHLRSVRYLSERPRGYLNEMSYEIILLTKGSDWSYEKEVRMLAPLSDASKILNQPDGDIHLFSYDPKSVKSIILGARTSQADKDKISRLIANDKDLRHVKLKEAKIDDDRYAVNII